MPRARSFCSLPTICKNVAVSGHAHVGKVVSNLLSHHVSGDGVVGHVRRSDKRVPLSVKRDRNPGCLHEHGIAIVEFGGDVAKLCVRPTARDQARPRTLEIFAIGQRWQPGEHANARLQITSRGDATNRFGHH